MRCIYCNGLTYPWRQEHDRCRAVWNTGFVEGWEHAWYLLKPILVHPDAEAGAGSDGSDPAGPAEPSVSGGAHT